MSASDDSGRPHRDAFAALRLVLASLVIVSHTAELVDGDGRREPLERLVGTTNLGFVAVYGFFLVSGYLVTASALRTTTRRAFLLKRVARIYPGFLLASLIAVLLVLPLSGGVLPPPRPLLTALARALSLQRPIAHGAFVGQPFHQDEVALNGAMWTIPYEFGCYLLAALFARAGARRPWRVAAIAVVLLAGSTLLPDRITGRLALPALLPGAPRLGLALLGMFATGAAFALVRDRIRFGGRHLLVAATGLAIGVPLAPLTPLALGIFGGYLLLAGARFAGATSLARLDARADISYGLYLYAWPVGQLLIRHAGSNDLPLLGAATWMIAAPMGWASWVLVERPALRLARKLIAPGEKPCRAMAP